MVAEGDAGWHESGTKSSVLIRPSGGTRGRRRASARASRSGGARAVVGARRLPSGGVVAMVEWPNPAHVDSEVSLIDLTVDERKVAHCIMFARLHAKKVALAAVRAVGARAATAAAAEREAAGHARRRCSRLAEGAVALRGGTAGTAVADGEVGGGNGGRRAGRGGWSGVPSWRRTDLGGRGGWAAGGWRSGQRTASDEGSCGGRGGR
eukprot:3531276-Prymnesium_polylepis.1